MSYLLFIGKPADVSDVTNVDWAPSLKLVLDPECTSDNNGTRDAWTQCDQCVTQNASTHCFTVKRRFVGQFFNHYLFL